MDRPGAPAGSYAAPWRGAGPAAAAGGLGGGGDARAPPLPAGGQPASGRVDGGLARGYAACCPPFWMAFIFFPALCAVGGRSVHLNVFLGAAQWGLLGRLAWLAL